MLGVFADDANDAAAVDDLALVTDLLYGCANFHNNSSIQPLPLNLRYC